jgi:fumarylacetoacetase
MDSTLKSFIAYDESHHFPLENIPFGCYNAKDGQKHCCTRIGDKLIDLALIFPKFDGEHFASLKGDNVFLQENLNKFAALGSKFRIEARATIQKFFTQGNEALLGYELLTQAVLPIEEQKMAMPMFIRDYTDFYSSKNHAHNIGVMFRGVDNALQPNWLHVPVGYHGRASSIVLDGTPITRPRGQTSADGKVPGFNNCKLMDFELEMGTIISQGNEQGCPIKIGDARNHIFGFCLLNDWSARDIQKWEYVPLGPFLAKNFASTISPWIVTPEALEPFKTAIPAQDPEVLPYL